MALNSISDLLQGIKRIYVGLQGVKSDGVTMEKIKTNDAGAMKVSAELTGSSATRLAGKGNGGLSGYGVGSLGAGVESVVVEVTQECWLESLVWAANNDANGIVMIYARKSDGTYPTDYYQFVKNDATDLAAPTIANLRTHKSDIFSLVVDSAGTYKATLNRRMYFANGVKIVRKNVSGSTAYNVGAFYLIATVQ